MTATTTPDTNAPTEPQALNDVYGTALRERLDDPADYWAVIGLLVNHYFDRIRHDHRHCTTTACLTCGSLRDADELFALHNSLQQPDASGESTYPYKLIGDRI
jgi:hypothetical protein